MRYKSSPGRNKHFMPELVASSDNSRPVLSKVHLNTEDAEIQVTDSYMLARFPVDLTEGDTSGSIPVDALKAYRKPPNKYRDVEVALNGTAEVRQYGEDGTDAPYITLPRDSADYTFPNVKRLVPDAPEIAFEIALDAAKLAKLAKAMGNDVVRLRFISPTRPILTYPGNGKIAEDAPSGLLMPVRLAD